MKNKNASTSAWRHHAKRTPSTPHTQGAAAVTAEQVRSMLESFAKNHVVTLSALTKRRIYKDFPNVPQGVSLGWAQLPERQGQGFMLGIFLDAQRIIPLSYADTQGHVFTEARPMHDTHTAEPVFAFVKDHDGVLPDSSRFSSRMPYGKTMGKQADGTRLRAVVAGNIVGRGEDGRMLWLASWLKSANRYSLEQLRTPLPANLRTNLRYRDAMAIAYFAAYFVPQQLHVLIGYGSGNIFRRLGREAPLSAIRRSVADTAAAERKGLRVSGLEQFFTDLMSEVNALTPINGLEAEHGAEPLRLTTSPLSDTYSFQWTHGLPFDAALQSLRLEGNLNRFAAVSAWLEHNDLQGLQPIEDTVTREQAALIDQALLRNPALLALGAPSRLGQQDQLQHEYVDVLREDGFLAINDIIELAGRITARFAQADTDMASPESNGNEGPRKSTTQQTLHDDRSNSTAEPGQRNKHAPISEWVYRRAMATMLRKLRLPFRFDTEFRVNLEEGRVAIAVTQAGPALMPAREYDTERRQWRQLSDQERANRSVNYNLRVALIMAALAFGADESIGEVDVRIDSIGLEEAVARQDSAIEAMVPDALNTFERLQKPSSDTVEKRVTSTQPTSAVADTDQPSKTVDSYAQSDVDSEFEQLMQGIDIDEVVFSEQFDQQDKLESSYDADNGIEVSVVRSRDDGQSDPLADLQSMPTMQPLVSVTLTRQQFLEHMAAVGLADPLATMRLFNATLDIDSTAGLVPTVPPFSLQDERFGPKDAQRAPEAENVPLSDHAAFLLGTNDTFGLAIERDDLLSYAMQTFQRLAENQTADPASRALQASRMIERINDPELYLKASDIATALIDGQSLQGMTFSWSRELSQERTKARDLLFSGQIEDAVTHAEHMLARYDGRFHDVHETMPADGNTPRDAVPRYFNSYAERVVYNKLFATAGERLTLVPNDLVYAHLELAELLSQLRGPEAALPHLNQVVAYAPAYAQAHLRLAMQLYRMEDWDSVKAVALNALRVSLDRESAADAYHYLGYTAWMRDEFEVAMACYALSAALVPGNAYRTDQMRELMDRMQSQCIPVPSSLNDVARVLTKAGMPLWPSSEIADIVGPAARVAVDQGLFVPGRTLAVADARLSEALGRGTAAMEQVQMQFWRSLNE
ncbi:putative tetratricopeptide repeat-containing domain protein [Bifidobacterium gallicum DSM 20093 = LMG 11596]|nr:putative tetratricopeptide repeat-containing domain protein [Bifidobacterium gallicum DSM 20093 = LMG 11596]